MKRIDDKTRKEIVDYFLSKNESSTEIGKIYNVSNSTVNTILREFGLNQPNKGRFIKKYFQNDNYFDNIDNEHKAYWLGWLYSDGYNNEDRGIVVLSLQEQDRETLEKFKIDLESTSPLQFIDYSQYKNYTNQYRLSINSKILSRKISQLGCWQNKSLTLEFPKKEQVPEFLIRDFIRGMWDGDGSICYCYLNNTKHQNLKGRLCVGCGITGTEHICFKIKEILKKELNINVHIRKDKDPDTPTRQLHINGTQQIRVFLQWLYKDSTIFLKRKYDKYQEILKLYHERGWDNPNKIPNTWKNDCSA